MEILEAGMKKLGLSCKKLATFFVVLFVALSVVFIAVTSMYYNSNFGVSEGFPKVLGRRAQNVTGELLGGGPNATATKGRAMNITSADIGLLKSDSVTTCSTNNSTSNTGNIDDDDNDNLHKLIDGLLASGFDEASCLSRFQSHLYRKPSAHKPSPYLISKLRNYEAMHRICGPNTRPYTRAMEKITSSKNLDDGSANSMCRYVLWTPSNGLGNKMISIVATFLYAILTKRVLLVRFDSDMVGLFCEPFLNSTWTLPNNSPFWNEQHVVRYQSLLDKNSNKDLELVLPSALLLHLNEYQQDLDKFFHCDHSQEIFNKVPLLIIESDQYFVPSLFMTPSFSTELNTMFSKDNAVFHLIGRYLFHPSNEVWGEVTRFYKAYLEKADEKIGVQVRVFHPDRTPHQEFMDQLLNCTMKNKILPNVDMRNSVSASAIGRNQPLKAVIVASLYTYYGDKLRAMYLKRPTVTGEVIGVYQPSHEEKQKFNDNVHNMKAWMEMYLLSLCDVLVTTSMSTFGYVAQGLGGLKPWQLYRMESNFTYFPACQRDLSLEPCLHASPKHQCGGKVEQRFANSFPNLCECKDFGGGVKLIG